MTKEQEKIEKAISNVLRGNDIESASCIVEKVVLDNYRLVTGRINVFKIATRQLLDYAKESKEKGVLDYAKENVKLKEQLKEKDTEIEKYKKLLADNLAKNLNDSIKAKEKADTDLDDLDKGWKVELEKKDKMIDLMAEYISDLDIDEDICKKQSDNNCDDINREVECKECIKQYFERIEKNERI